MEAFLEGQYKHETSGRMERIKDWTKQRGMFRSNGNMPILNLVLLSFEKGIKICHDRRDFRSRVWIFNSIWNFGLKKLAKKLVRLFNHIDLNLKVLKD